MDPAPPRKFHPGDLVFPVGYPNIRLRVRSVSTAHGMNYIRVHRNPIDYLELRYAPLPET